MSACRKQNTGTPQAEKLPEAAQTVKLLFLVHNTNSHLVSLNTKQLTNSIRQNCCSSCYYQSEFALLPVQGLFVGVWFVSLVFVGFFFLIGPAIHINNLNVFYFNLSFNLLCDLKLQNYFTGQQLIYFFNQSFKDLLPLRTHCLKIRGRKGTLSERKK